MTNNAPQLGPGSWSSRAWSWLLGALLFVVLVQVLVGLLRPLLPWLVVVGLVGLALTVWNQRRWR